MGIFMITISQISSHTVAGVYPRAPASTGDRGLEPGLDQGPPVDVVLRDVERRARPREIDESSGGDPNGHPGDHLVDLRVRALIDGDPMRAGHRFHPRVRERTPPGIAAEDVQPRIKQMTVEEPSGRGAAPWRRALTGRIDASVARIQRPPAPVREGQALADDSDSLDHHRI